MRSALSNQSEDAMRASACELLERAETTLLAIYSGEIRATDEDTWTMVGFRLALQWVLGFAGTAHPKDEKAPDARGLPSSCMR